MTATTNPENRAGRASSVGGRSQDIYEGGFSIVLPMEGQYDPDLFSGKDIGNKDDLPPSAGAGSWLIASG
jgi:hypothetical protein